MVQDEHVDGAVALVAPLAMTKPLEVAHALASAATKRASPCSPASSAARNSAKRACSYTPRRSPSCPSPEAAVEAFGYLASFEQSQRMLLEVPAPWPTAPRLTSTRTRVVHERAVARAAARCR